MTVSLKGLHIVKAKGRSYVYAWRGGPRLEEKPGTEAFLAELLEIRKARTTGEAGKVSGLIALYKSKPAWTGLSDKTRENWSPWLDRIQEHFGKARVEVFDRARMVPRIIDWRDGYARTPRSADMGKQVLSRLLSFAGERGLLTTNPCEKIPNIYRNDRSAIIWTEADLAALAKHSSPEIMHAARLAGLTGLRQADLLRLNWSHLKPDCIEIATNKSGKRRLAVIPRYAELDALLASIPKRGPRILTNTDHHPWKTGFGASFGAAKGRACIDKHFHDLRGTAATKFYIALRKGDVSDKEAKREIADIMAWSEATVSEIIDTYVNRDAIMKSRITRLNGTAAERNV